MNCGHSAECGHVFVGCGRGPAGFTAIGSILFGLRGRKNDTPFFYRHTTFLPHPPIFTTMPLNQPVTDEERV